MRLTEAEIKALPRNKYGLIPSTYRDMLGRKYCPGCKSMHPEKHFWKTSDPVRLDGRQNNCKDCLNRYKRENRRRTSLRKRLMGV